MVFLEQRALCDISEMLMDLRRAHGEFLANFRHHTLTEEPPGSLAERSPPHQRPKEPPDQQPVMTPQQGWSLLPSVTNPPLGIKPWAVPRLRLEPPRFDGENASDWIRKIQKYYNHHYTPLDDRLYLTQYLFDHPASDWREHWVETNKGKSWDDFLLDVKQWFDPDLYESYTATASIGPFGSTRGTRQAYLQPKRRTEDPVGNQEPNSQPAHQIEEVKQAVIVIDEHNAYSILIDKTCSEALHMVSEIIAEDINEDVRYDMEQVAQVQALTEPRLPREGSRDPVDEEVVNKGVSPDLGADSGVSSAIMSSSFNGSSLYENYAAEEVLPTWDPGASVGYSSFGTIEEHNVGQFETSNQVSPFGIVTGKGESDNSKVRESMRVNGGLREDNFLLITDGGIDTETYYPYTSIAITCATYRHLARVVSIDLHDDDAMAKGIYNRMNNKEGQTCDSRWVNPPKPPSLGRSSDADSIIATLEEFFEISQSCLLCIGLDHVVHLMKGSRSSHNDLLHNANCNLNSRLGYCLLNRKLLDSRQLNLVWKIKFNDGTVDFIDSIYTDVASFESKIFCRRVGNSIAHTPFVERKVFDGADRLRIRKGIKDLVCDNEWLKVCCSGDFLKWPKFLYNELYESIREVSYLGDDEWSFATPRFGGDNGVRIFDPGDFEGTSTLDETHMFLFHYPP